MLESLLLQLLILHLQQDVCELVLESLVLGLNELVDALLDIGVLLDLEQEFLTEPGLVVEPQSGSEISLLVSLRARLCPQGLLELVERLPLFPFSHLLRPLGSRSCLWNGANSLLGLSLLSPRFLLFSSVVSLVVESVDLVEEGEESVDSRLSLLRNVAVVIAGMSANLPVSTNFLFCLLLGRRFRLPLLVASLLQTLLRGLGLQPFWLAFTNFFAQLALVADSQATLNLRLFRISGLLFTRA